MRVSYEVKHGEVISPNKAQKEGKPHRMPPFELSQVLSSHIPKGVAIEDVLHALNMLMAEAISKCGEDVAEHKRIAEAFHGGIVRSLEMNHLVKGRIQNIRDEMVSRGEELTQEMFRELVEREMKSVKQEMQNVQ
jgi:hypothetical protein